MAYVKGVFGFDPSKRFYIPEAVYGETIFSLNFRCSVLIGSQIISVLSFSGAMTTSEHGQRYTLNTVLLTQQSTWNFSSASPVDFHMVGKLYYRRKMNYLRPRNPLESRLASPSLLSYRNSTISSQVPQIFLNRLLSVSKIRSSSRM